VPGKALQYCKFESPVSASRSAKRREYPAAKSFLLRSIPPPSWLLLNRSLYDLYGAIFTLSLTIPFIEALLVMSYILSRYFQTNNRKKENPHDGAAGFRESKHRPADPSSKSLQRRHTTGSLYSYPTGTLEKGRSRIKDLLERFKQQKAGYDGVAHRSRTLYLPESVPYRLDSGTCLQCGHETPHEELLDQSRIDGYVVGICNDCYPEFLRSLEDTNETQDLEPTVEPERIDWDERPVFGIAPETIREARRGTPREITRQCEVCREPRIGSEFRPATFNCQHDIHYCVGCLGDWISSKIESRELDGIQCPSTECRSKLDAGEVQAVTDRETFER